MFSSQKTKPKKKGKTHKRTWNESPGGTPKKKRQSQELSSAGASFTATRKLNFSEADGQKGETNIFHHLRKQ